MIHSNLVCVLCVVRASVVCFVSLFLVAFPSSSVAPWRCFILDFDSKENAMLGLAAWVGRFSGLVVGWLVAGWCHLKRMKLAAMMSMTSMDGCANWMLCMFLPKSRAQLRHLAAFYLQNTLMPKVAKANPLFAEFTQTVVNGKLLHTKRSREMWIKATESNRSQRFAKVPNRGKA